MSAKCQSPANNVCSWPKAASRVIIYCTTAAGPVRTLKTCTEQENTGDMEPREFDRAIMVCQIENLFQDGAWAILEWSDPKGLRGYFNELSFLRQQGLPLPRE